MAEEAAVGLGFLLENLKQLLLYNAHLILNVKSYVESLHNDLQLFNAFLKDMAKRDNNPEVLNTLVKQIRDVVYEAEDCVDMYVSHSAMQKARSGLEKAVHIFDDSTKLRDMAEKIKSIRAMVNYIFDDTRNTAVENKSMRAKVNDIYQDKKYGFEAQLVAAPPVKKEEAPIVEDNVVGFKDEAEKVTKLLIEGPEELQVISIVGMAGLGKTTLAKMIYTDPNVIFKFYNCAWIFVSQEYSKKEVLQDILRQFTKPSDVDMNEDELADELRKFLEKGNYLIVMDDVWTNEAWDDLKTAFPENKNKSRILLTTSIEKVANHANPNIDPYKLRFLTTEECTILLRRKALGSMECPDELREHELQIVQKCRGLPLAIVVIGGILLGKGKESESWKKVAESVEAFINMDDEKKMDHFIEMSFDNLPYHLKTCFLYFGIFPEDFQIPVWKLLRLWIAEGFIQQSEGMNMSLEDIAEEYLEDFISRNLVMVGQRRLNGKVKTCHIHDMLHLFCKKRAVQESFFVEITQLNQGTCSSSNLDSEKCRRLSINSKILEYISSKPTGPRVRSFLCFAPEEITLQRGQNSSIPCAFKLLRVLDGKPIHFTRFPADLTQLVHLRYLVLSCNFEILPAALSSLWNMQTLVVETSSRTLEIKADVWKMIQMRHLKTNVSTTLKGPLAKSRKSKEDSRNFQTLSTISPESCTEGVFAAAPCLRKLGIRGKLAKLLHIKHNGSSLFDCLGKLDYLENLKLWNDVYPQPPSEGKISSLPQNYKFPSNLKKLTIVETRLDWKHMSTLGLLEGLEILKLKDNAFIGDLWKSQDGGFRSLIVLHIGRTDLVYWKASAVHFPRLKCLRLNHCSELDEVPFELANVPSFQILDLKFTTRAAAVSAKTISEHKRQPGGSGFELSIYPPDHYQ
ncbi:late blight resistance homolog R1A-10 [Olea europaea subsp. europaea]|uniref:Late blight resistance homolog R1A-10 n=1 Tax=Olea europaea subsp. europaea TaxID=158383 RepID=A0A8S0VCV6_OLEEU|nr:late blight resistance homolog R1A-10 [Olea europaea subsp. europaea]